MPFLPRLRLSGGTNQTQSTSRTRHSTAPSNAGPATKKEQSGALSPLSSRSASKADSNTESARSAGDHKPTITKSTSTASQDTPKRQLTPDEYATKVQARFRGNQERKKVSVSTIPNSGGMVKVHIAGDSADLERVGFKGIDTTHGPKDLTYLKVPLDKYSPHLAGGENVRRPTDAPPARVREQMARDRTDPESSKGPVAYINGSFYNASKSRKASPEHDEAAAVGKNKVVGATEQPEPMPIPKEYAKDYQSVRFPNGSTLTTAPLLSDSNWRGKSVPRFDQNKLDDPKYQYPQDGHIRPGDLQHAEHPNPRSAVNFPAGIKPTLGIRRSEIPHKSGDAVRMLVASDNSGKVGATSQGLTMPELSNVMARVGELNKKPGPSYNLDGGGSSVMGVVSEDGRKLMEVKGRANETPAAVNFIAMEQKPEKGGSSR